MKPADPAASNDMDTAARRGRMGMAKPGGSDADPTPTGRTLAGGNLFDGERVSLMLDDRSARVRVFDGQELRSADPRPERESECRGTSDKVRIPGSLPLTPVRVCLKPRAFRPAAFMPRRPAADGGVVGPGESIHA